MNKKSLFISILLLVFVLTACDSTAAVVSGQVSGTAETAQSNSNPQTVGEDQEKQDVGSGSEQQDSFPGGLQQPGDQTTPQPGFDREMPLAMTLALGTFKLEGSEYPVNAEQAAEMLVLWKAVRSLSESDNTAVEEMDALFNQVQAVFSPGQIAEIEAMELSFQDMRAVAEQMGIELGFGGRFGDLTPEQQATIEAARESGQFPGGGFGGGFPGGGPGGGQGGGPGGAGLSPEQRETAIAERGGFPRISLGLPQLLLEALIEFLEGKAG